MISKNFKHRVYTSLFLFLLIFLIFVSKMILVFSLITLGILSILEFSNILTKITKNKFYFFCLNSFFIIFIFLFCFYFLSLSMIFQFKLILFILLFGCIASDIGGYVFGKTIKGPKLTKISPKKTISGAFGSIIFCIIIISFLFFYFTGLFSFKILFSGLVTSISCQLGDLFFSFLKRKVKIKDTGNFFPGHGGVLDRLDGIFVGLPIGYITLILTI